MDPNPSNHPILSFVMSKLPSFNSPRFSAARPPDDFDIEQPPPPSPSKEPYFELTERMPHLTDSKVLAAMRLAIADVSTARSVLKTLGERPDHETVDTARARLSEIDFEMSKQLEEIALSPRPDETDRADWRSEQAAKEEEDRQAREKERQMYKAVISLDEMHESYAKLLSDAERRLEKIYETAKDGTAAEENSGETSGIVAEEEVNEEVVRILEDALSNGAERIDLSERRMRFLPEAFGKLRTLVVLNLSSNQFEIIPDSIAGLENLEELNLSSNQLGSLPDSIGLLLKLKILDVSSNKLTCLPDSICHCRSLVELDASLNKLTYIPTNIGFELVNLRRLSIQLNKIRSLPTSIGEMRSLQYLDVHFNELRGLPLAIGRLSNLEVLNLSSNFSDLTELPHTVGDLTNLKECDLSNNQIHELPVTFGRLENLTKLNLDQNPIVIPPVEVINQGIEAVKMFLAKRWLDVLVKEEERSTLEMQEEAKAGWLTRSTSWLNNAVTSVSGYLAKSNADPYLDQQL